MSNQEYKDNELLYHILEAIENVAAHQSGACAKFTIERAIIYELVIIGEAVGDLSKALKESFRRCRGRSLPIRAIKWYMTMRMYLRGWFGI